MLQINFQNKVEDLDALAAYMAYATDEGKRVGKLAHRGIQIPVIILCTLLGLYVWHTEDSTGTALMVSLGMMVLLEIVFMAMSNFKPNYYYGYKVYKKQEKNY